MKKQLLFALALLITGLMKAQTWTENFNSAVPPALPAGWMQNNVDGNTTSTVSVIAGFNFGTNAGVTRNITTAFNYPATYSISLITTSAYQPSGTSNDWIISPSFTVPANAVFNWQARSADPVQTEAYEIRISTTGTAVADFLANPALFTTTGETYVAGSFTTRGVSLDAYAGQTAYLAVHDISSNKWTAYYDNFEVTVPSSATDGNILSVSGLTRYMVGAGNQNISGTFKELGYATATTAVINYNVNNGSPVSQTFTFSPTVPYYGTANFTFSTQANLGLGTNNIKVWVSDVNGSPETVNTNDTATAVVYVASQSVTIQALIEEFTSSTCGPCASLNQTFDPLLSTNSVNIPGSNVNAVKYQVNWPSPNNDPSYNPDVLTRRNFYGVNAAPTVLFNGTAGSGNQSNINIAKAQPGYATIVPSISIVGSAVTANATITPYVTIPSSSPIRVYQALLQSYYNYPSASTSQKDYHHAMRKMFTASGTNINTTDGSPLNVNFNHNVTYASIAVGDPTPGTYNFWTNIGTFTYEYIVWIQDEVNRQVLQSGSAFTSTISTGVVEYKNNNSIGVYPNPAKDYAVVGIKLDNSSAVDIAIYDVTGKKVYENKGTQLEGGEHEIMINTSEFASGTYNIMVNAGKSVMKEKLIIVK